MNKIFLLIIFAFVILAILFLGYLTINKNDDVSLLSSSASNMDSYTTAKPRYGNFINTIEAKAIFNNNLDVGMTSVDLSMLKQLRTGQDIILKDKDGSPLPLAGKIQTIRDYNKGVDILFTLPEQTDTTQLSPMIEIIYFESNALKLLPISALQKDTQTQESYLWALENNNLKKIKILDFYQNDTHVAVNSNDDLIYIINPDDKITLDNNTLKFNTIELETPSSNPIYAAWLKYNAAKLAFLNQGIQDKIAACGKPSAEDSPSPSATDNIDTSGDSCSDTQSTIISAEEIFSTIQTMKDGNTNVQEACGDDQANSSCN